MENHLVVSDLKINSVVFCLPIWSLAMAMEDFGLLIRVNCILDYANRGQLLLIEAFLLKYRAFLGTSGKLSKNPTAPIHLTLLCLQAYLAR